MPLFKHSRSEAVEGFVDVVAAERVIEDEMTIAQVQGRRVILTRHEGTVYAIDSLCPHAAADLSQGSLRRWRICCHEHDYCFDIRSGHIVWPDDEPYRLQRYEAREANGMVQVRIAAGNQQR